MTRSSARARSPPAIPWRIGATTTERTRFLFSTLFLSRRLQNRMAYLAGYDVFARVAREKVFILFIFVLTRTQPHCAFRETIQKQTCSGRSRNATVRFIFRRAYLCLGAKSCSHSQSITWIVKKQSWFGLNLSKDKIKQGWNNTATRFNRATHSLNPWNLKGKHNPRLGFPLSAN